MIGKLGIVMRVAVEALRQHPLRSILSMLGLIIGVAALVGILALADGMERYAREQISTTTDLQTISIAPRTVEQIDGVPVRRDTVRTLGPAEAAALGAHLDGRARVTLMQRRPVGVERDTVRTAAMLYAADAGLWSLAPLEVVEGRRFTAGDVAAARPVVVLSQALAERLGGNAEEVVGRRIRLGDADAEVIGVVTAATPRPAEVYAPYPAFARATARDPASLMVQVARAEEVPLVTREVEAWLDAEAEGGSAAYQVQTDRARTEQVRKGMLLFKLILGLITGISVLVGGIGVMNVLLITVTERTREIGIRKAVGARRRDILLQFLAEAMTVSGTGSLLGLLLGLGGVFAVAPVVRALVDAPFQPAITWQTLIVVGVVALAVGIGFGTYPALRASRLDPADAIRHE